MISNTTSKNVTKNIFKNHYIYEEDDSKSIYTGIIIKLQVAHYYQWKN